MALRNMLVRIGSDITGLRKGLQQAQKDIAFFGRNVTGSLKEIQGQVAGASMAIGAGFAVSGAVQDAMRYEALMTTLGESMGKSREDFEKWQQTVGASMGYSKLQAAETANILSLNFKKIATDQADLVGKTTKMMEVAAVVANKRGMTMQEVSDRIRSAMNQEADGADELGVNVRQAALEQTKAYQELAAGQPFDKLNEKMRQTILYNAILEQVSANLGTTIQDTTAMRMAVFTAALADVRLALGQAFMPILYNVLPILTVFARALEKVLQYIAAFMASLFGGFKFQAPVTKGDVATTNKQAAALGDVGKAADKAGKAGEKAGKKSSKAAKKAAEAWTGLFGFDEVHTIEDPKADADKGAGAADVGKGADVGGLDAGGLGGLGLDAGGALDGVTAAMGELVGKMDKFTKPIREAFKKVWSEISGFFKDQLGQITSWWQEHGDTITKGMKRMASIIWAVIKTIGKFVWDSIKMVIEGAITFFRGFITFLSGVFTGDFKAIWDGIKDMFFGALEALLGFWNLTFIGGMRKFLFEFAQAVGKRILGMAGELKGIFSKNVTDLTNYWKGLLANIKKIAGEMKAFVDGKVELMQTSFKNFWDRVAKWAKDAVGALKSVWGGVKEWFYRTVISPIAERLDNIRAAFGRGVTAGIKELLNSLIRGLNNALGGFNALKNATPLGGAIPDLRIPYLAKGGIATRATLAMVGEGSQNEAIAPLDRLQGFISNAVVAAMRATGGGGTGGDIILNIDGRRLARIVKPFLDAENKRIGTNVKLNPL